MRDVRNVDGLVIDSVKAADLVRAVDSVQLIDLDQIIKTFHNSGGQMYHHLDNDFPNRTEYRMGNLHQHRLLLIQPRMDKMQQFFRNRYVNQHHKE